MRPTSLKNSFININAINYYSRLLSPEKKVLKLKK